jgi:ClpP class serine protease
VQRDVHDVFIGVVKDRRAGKLRASDAELFSGAFWSAARALDLGLIDGVADVRSKLRQMHGEKVVLKLVPIGGGGLLSRLRRVPGSSEALPLVSADDLVSTLEARALWSRFGL